MSDPARQNPEGPAALPVPDGVPCEAWLKIARAEGTRWAIAERDAIGEVIGTAYRDAAGGKTFAPGGKRGLIVAWPLATYAGSSPRAPVYVCEGASDTAALLGLGLEAVGVPMAGQCGGWLAELLDERHVVIVRDADSAGQNGALKLVAALKTRCASVRVIDPPESAKDARAAVLAGAKRAAFEDAAKRAEPENSTPAMDEPLLFSPISAAALIRAHPDLRPVVIGDLLRQGEVMNVVAAPKVGKSWLVHALAMAVSSGGPWLGRATSQGRVLLIDGELHHETLARRLRAIHGASGLPGEALGALQVWPVRGRRLTIDGIAAALGDVPCGTYRLIVIDALYRFLPLGGEENSNESVTAIYNTLDSIADRQGAAVAVVHHASKGDQSGKNVTDVGSGAGSQSRAADTHLVLRAHEEEGAVVVDAAVRSFPPLAPFVIRDTRPGWALAPELDPALLRRPSKRIKAQCAPPAKPPEVTIDWTPEAFATIIVGPEPSIRHEVIARARERGLSAKHADSLLQRAEASGLVHRWVDGPSARHRFSTNPPETLDLGGGGPH